MRIGANIDHFEHDAAFTRANYDKLRQNKNLLFWYRNLYKRQFEGEGDVSGKVILEIGSGTSPMKLFYTNVVTSDILDLGYLDHIFDCHNIDRFESIKDASIDIITLTNVLHHLKDPLDFLKKAACKLKPGGHIIFTEPYFSVLSRAVYKYLHHEPFFFDIDSSAPLGIEGPLSSSNMAMPFLIFLKHKDRSKALKMVYSFSDKEVMHYSSLSYMITGGISRRLPIPHILYKSIFNIDLWLARTFPGFFSSFFIMKLKKK